MINVLVDVILLMTNYICLYGYHFKLVNRSKTNIIEFKNQIIRTNFLTLSIKTYLIFEKKTLF